MISSQQSSRTFQCKVNWGWTGNFHGYKDGCAFPWWWRLIFMQRCPGDQEKNAWLEHPRGAQRAGKWVALMTLKRLGTRISTNPEIPNTLCRSQVPLTVLDFFLSFLILYHTLSNWFYECTIEGVPLTCSFPISGFSGYIVLLLTSLVHLYSCYSLGNTSPWLLEEDSRGFETPPDGCKVKVRRHQYFAGMSRYFQSYHVQPTSEQNPIHRGRSRMTAMPVHLVNWCQFQASEDRILSCFIRVALILTRPWKCGKWASSKTAKKKGV